MHSVSLDQLTRDSLAECLQDLCEVYNGYLRRYGRAFILWGITREQLANYPVIILRSCKRGLLVMEKGK